MSGSRKVDIEGKAGRLEALWRGPSGPGATFDRAVVLCHPHPLHGGTMENRVVARTARYLADAGLETLRFNFRGVGQSDGSWDAGRGERDDVRSAIEYVQTQSALTRFAVVGYSFGSLVGLDVGSADPAVDLLIGIAPPLKMYDYSATHRSPKPKLIVYGGKDGFLDPAFAKDWVSSANPPAEGHLIPEADHFFGPFVDEIASAVTRFVRSYWQVPS